RSTRPRPSHSAMPSRHRGQPGTHPSCGAPPCHRGRPREAMWGEFGRYGDRIHPTFATDGYVKPSSSSTIFAKDFGATIVYDVRTHSSIWRHLAASGFGPTVIDTQPALPRP